MQASPARGTRGGAQQPAVPGALRRTLAYLGKQRGTTIAAYGALILATLAQLAVPQLVQNMIDAISPGTAADRAVAESLLINAALLIVLFAVMRGIFSFVQAFMAGRPRRAWPSTCATRSSPRSSACRLATTTATRPAS